MSVEGFDPKEDTAGTPRGGTVKKMYQLLQTRGMHDEAEKLRREPSLSGQFQLAEQYPEYDPQHDPLRVTSRGGILRVYEWLAENGHDEEAEELRTLGTVREQRQRVARLRQQYDIPLLKVSN